MIQIICDICNKSYANKYVLNIKTIHEKAIHYKYLLGCDKEFKSQYRLFVHHLYHEGIKAFKYNICFKDFFDIGTLKNQKKTHLNQNLFNCTLCDFKCAKINDLVVHFKNAHKLKK